MDLALARIDEFVVLTLAGQLSEIVTLPLIHYIMASSSIEQGFYPSPLHPKEVAKSYSINLTLAVTDPSTDASNNFWVSSGKSPVSFPNFSWSVGLADIMSVKFFVVNGSLKSLESQILTIFEGSVTPAAPM